MSEKSQFAEIFVENQQVVDSVKWLIHFQVVYYAHGTCIFKVIEMSWKTVHGHD